MWLPYGRGVCLRRTSQLQWLSVYLSLLDTICKVSEARWPNYVNRRIRVSKLQTCVRLPIPQQSDPPNATLGNDDASIKVLPLFSNHMQGAFKSPVIVLNVSLSSFVPQGTSTESSFR